MKGFVFVPGLTGSQLTYKATTNLIWPPDLGDLAGYQKIAKLLDPTHVHVKDIIDTVILPCVNVYKTTEDDLRNISNHINHSTAGPYLPAPYDWRVNIFKAADQIEKKIEDWFKSTQPNEIAIVCHSFGGLVVRLLLESKYTKVSPDKRPPWFKLVSEVFFVCTPHLGAPKALTEILGLEDEETIRATDVKKLAADIHFPAAYQLLPSASRDILYDAKTQQYLRYDDSHVVTALGLSTPNLQALQKSSSALDWSKKPANVAYMFVYATGQPTEEGVEIQGLSLDGAKAWNDDETGVPSGDGTVPSWSITEAATRHSPSVPMWSGPGDHVGILTTYAFRQELYNYFGLRGGMAPLLTKDKTGVVVSLNKHCYREGETIHVLLVPDFETEKFSGTLSLGRLNDDGKAMMDVGVQREVSIRGGSIRSFPVKLAAPHMPGGYRLDFGGSGATHSTPERTAGWFTVVPSDHRGRRAPRRR